MKKSLVLAMAMALGVTASAYAANPFSDVPAGHWAYDSVAKLAAAGVVDGYVDGTYGGDKLITRYEMAQIVAKAMAKGANVDKLAAEFADELDTLGVRVAKLEKGADAVKIAGQIRAHYQKNDNAASASKLRTRLFINGQVNEDWTYTARFQNEQVFAHDNDSEEEDTKLNWAFLTGKLGGMKVTAGRQDFKPHTGWQLDSTVDGLSFAYGKDVKLTGYIAKATGNLTTLESEDRLYIADLSTKVGVFDTYATYYKLNVDKTEGWDKEVVVIGAATKLAKDLGLKAEYMMGDAVKNADDNGYAVGLSYKGAKASTPGSWGLWANYFDQPAATYLEHTLDGYTPMKKFEDNDPSKAGFTDGFEGYEVGVNYALAKNIVAGVRYYDIEAREGKGDEQTLWSEVIFTF